MKKIKLSVVGLMLSGLSYSQCTNSKQDSIILHKYQKNVKMFKEIKYIIFVFIIGLFIFFTAKYYFSDAYKKKSYRSLNNIENKINTYSEKLPILEDDTKNIIEYVEQTNNKKKKKFNFWKLLENNE